MLMVLIQLLIKSTLVAIHGEDGGRFNPGSH